MSAVSPNTLPSGWAVDSLGTVVDILDSQRVPINSEERAKRLGKVPYYGATGQVGWIDDHLFDEELVLLGEDGAPFLESTKPKAYLIEGRSWVNNHAHVLRGKNGISNRFLMYQLNQVNYRPFVSGTTRLKLPQAPMRQIPLVIAPEKEQRRIVAEIEKQFTRLDAAVAALKRVQANLKRYRASVLKAACEGRLVPTEAELARREGRSYELASALLNRISPASEATNSEPTADDLRDLPTGWTWTTLFSLVVDGPQNGLYLPKSSYGRGAPILRIDDFQSHKSRPSTELKLVEADEEELATYSLTAGDMVVNRVNSPSHLGKTLLVEERNLPALFESNMMRIRLHQSISTQYVVFYLSSVDGRARLTARAKWAVNQASINQQDVLATPVPLPPLAEEDRIVTEVFHQVSILEEIRTEIEKDIRRADKMRQSVLKRAFEGKLVPQDPNDEPASTLLERIRGTAIPGCAPVRAKSNKPSRRAPVSKETGNA